MTSITPTPGELEMIRRLKDHHLLLLIADLQRSHGWCVARETLKRLAALPEYQPETQTEDAD
jgi:hypothetical protein